jgi:hypothetical protein
MELGSMTPPPLPPLPSPPSSSVAAADAEGYIVNAHLVINPVAQQAQDIPNVEGLFERTAHFSDFKCHCHWFVFSSVQCSSYFM